MKMKDMEREWVNLLNERMRGRERMKKAADIE